MSEIATDKKKKLNHTKLNQTNQIINKQDQLYTEYRVWSELMGEVAIEPGEIKPSKLNQAIQTKPIFQTLASIKLFN